MPLLSAFLAAQPALAHHSFIAEFDANQWIELKGVVTRVEWMKPHVFFYVDVKDAKRKDGALGRGRRTAEYVAAAGLGQGDRTAG